MDDCFACFSSLFRIRVYIQEGWDQKYLVDPDGKLSEKKREEAKSEEERSYEKFLTGSEVPAKSWTSNIDQVPPITHSIVENFFKKTNDKRHLTEGYAFSVTKKFETSGKPMQVNFDLKAEDGAFLLEGYSRPAMRQAKGILSGQGLYKCTILFNKSGEILAAKDHSCPAGKRGFCKHVAALAYKLVEAKMSGQKHLPKPLSCTDIRQQWGVPSLKAHQDPEKEIMKRKPLQNITFKKHLLNASDDAKGVCPATKKRKLPNEVVETYSSRPRGEPLVDQERVKVGPMVSISIGPVYSLFIILYGPSLKNSGYSNNYLIYGFFFYSCLYNCYIVSREGIHKQRGFGKN